MNHKLTTILPRIPLKHATLREDVATAFSIADAFSAKAKSVRDDPNLTYAGKVAALKTALGAGGHLDHLAQIRTKVQRQKAEIALRRKGMTTRKPAADALAFQKQAEIRAWLRSLTEAERRRAVLNASDPSIKEAVVDAPPELSGLDSNFVVSMKETLFAEQHGPALRDLAEQENALNEALGAIALAEADLHREVE